MKYPREHSNVSHESQRFSPQENLREKIFSDNLREDSDCSEGGGDSTVDTKSVAHRRIREPYRYQQQKKNQK